MATRTDEPDLLGMELAHRAMREETRRLTGAVRAIADGTADAPPQRTRAIATYVRRMCDGIRHHHEVEDDELWPVVRAAAGEDVDLRELEEDHAALDPLLDDVRRAAEAFAATPAHAQAQAARRLADAVDVLHRVLDEHMGEEERTAFPAIRRYVSREEWRRVERIAAGGSDLSWDVPRVLGYASREERAALAPGARGLLLSGVLLLHGPRYRRFERLVMG